MQFESLASINKVSKETKQNLSNGIRFLGNLMFIETVIEFLRNIPSIQ